MEKKGEKKSDNQRLLDAIFVVKEKLSDKSEKTKIGTLGEKTLHAVLKYFYEENSDFHEVKIGPYFADIANENGIIEIQTASFDRLRKKLAVFLNSGDVTIVYPVGATKQLIWIDADTGLLSAPRKSPKKGSVYAILHELYRISDFLEHPGLHFRILLLDMTEYRILNGWSKDKKHGSTRYERIPSAFYNEIFIDEISDYQIFVPADLPSQFMSCDYQKATKLSKGKVSKALLILTKLRILLRVGKKGNAFIYERSQFT